MLYFSESMVNPAKKLYTCVWRRFFSLVVCYRGEDDWDTSRRSLGLTFSCVRGSCSCRCQDRFAGNFPGMVKKRAFDAAKREAREKEAGGSSGEL